MNAWREWLFNPVTYFVAFSVSSLFVMLAIGNPLIAWLKGLKGMKWSPREDTPDSHLQKAGVPSMGGIGIIGSAVFGYLAVFIALIIVSRFAYPTPSPLRWKEFLPFLLLPGIVIGHALLGFTDDWSKARGKGGLLARQKLIGQIVLAVLFLAIFSWEPLYPHSLKGLATDLNWSAYLGLILVLIGTSNAVNLTDGIDGLAAGLSVQCAAAFTFCFYEFKMVPGSESGYIALFFWFCLGASCLGFLAFNKNPAKVFMGDTGSLALGAALGAAAVLTGSVFLLPFIGFIFFVEMFSVIFQVAYFKITKKKLGEGRRIFRRAPLHHHYELGGWSEWRVVGTFWAINALTTAIGVGLWKTDLIPHFP